MKKSKHNPLMNPVPGDVVRAKNGKKRCVLTTVDDGTVKGSDVEYSSKKQEVDGILGDGLCCLRTWRRWCKENKATVVKKGREWR